MGFEEIAEILLNASEILFCVVFIGIFLTLLILSRIGIYTIAKRRRIKCAWLTWLPVGNHYILGSISDQYQALVKGKRTCWRWILAVAVTIGTVGIVAALVILVAMVLYSLLMLLAIVGSLGLVFLSNDFEDMFGDMREPLVWMCISGSVALPAIGIRYFALYDLYRSCAPKYQVLCLVLSILFPVAEPILLLLCSNMDCGMPQPVDKD